MVHLVSQTSERETEEVCRLWNYCGAPSEQGKSADRAQAGVKIRRCNRHGPFHGLGVGESWLQKGWSLFDDVSSSSDKSKPKQNLVRTAPAETSLRNQHQLEDQCQYGPPTHRLGHLSERCAERNLKHLGPGHHSLPERRMMSFSPVARHTHVGLLCLRNSLQSTGFLFSNFSGLPSRRPRPTFCVRVEAGAQPRLRWQP
jgi:hypothetical protein